MNTTTNKIGYVAAMGVSNSEVTGGVDAFAMGVELVNPDATVYVKVTNSWFSIEGETSAAQALVDMGCDVIAQHCDTPNPQTIAEAAGVYGIGYNSDMSKDAPDATLTSVMWDWSVYYTAAVQSIIDGTWTSDNYYEGMDTGLVKLSALASFCKEGTAEKVEEYRQLILSGEFNVFDGTMTTNTGDTVTGSATLPNGTATLSDSEITGGINWYYKNVIGD